MNHIYDYPRRAVFKSDLIEECAELKTKLAQTRADFILMSALCVVLVVLVAFMADDAFTAKSGKITAKSELHKCK